MKYRAILAHLRYWGMANATMKMGIQISPEVQEVERKLYRELMDSMLAIRVSDVN